MTNKQTNCPIIDRLINRMHRQQYKPDNDIIRFNRQVKDYDSPKTVSQMTIDSYYGKDVSIIKPYKPVKCSQTLTIHIPIEKTNYNEIKLQAANNQLFFAILALLGSCLEVDNCQLIFNTLKYLIIEYFQSVIRLDKYALRPRKLTYHNVIYKCQDIAKTMHIYQSTGQIVLDHRPIKPKSEKITQSIKDRLNDRVELYDTLKLQGLSDVDCRKKINEKKPKTVSQKPKNYDVVVFE